MIAINRLTVQFQTMFQKNFFERFIGNQPKRIMLDQVGQASFDDYFNIFDDISFWESHSKIFQNPFLF